MERSTQKKTERKEKRALRNRKNLCGTALRPRMSIVKTNRHIHVQIIDDERGHTVASLSTQSKELASAPKCGRNKQTAELLGKNIAEKLKVLGIELLVLDRGPFKYHGIIEKIATSCREAGLKF